MEAQIGIEGRIKHAQDVREGHPIIAQGDYTISIGGGQPDTGAPTVNGKFHIDGQVDLAE